MNFNYRNYLRFLRLFLLLLYEIAQSVWLLRLTQSAESFRIEGRVKRTEKRKANRRIFHLTYPVVAFLQRVILETASAGRSIRQSCRGSFERGEWGTKRKRVDLKQREAGSFHPRARDFVNVLTAFSSHGHSVCSASWRPFKGMIDAWHATDTPTTRPIPVHPAPSNNTGVVVRWIFRTIHPPASGCSSAGVPAISNNSYISWSTF